MEYLICFILIFIAVLLTGVCALLVLIHRQMVMLHGTANQVLMQNVLQSHAGAAQLMSGGF